MGDSTEARGERLETVVAILIALVTVIGAIVAWRASVVADASGDADFAGLRASVNAEETRALNYVNAYEQYGSFLNFKRHREMAALLAGGMEEGADNAVLQSQLEEEIELANANLPQFNRRFMSRDGATFNVQRQIGEMWADAVKERDLNPDPQYAEADVLRDKTNYLLIALSVLALSLVFFSLVEATEGGVKTLLVVLGVITMIIGTGAALYIELGMK